MADFDPNMIKDMAKLKSVNEADELLRGMKEPGKENEIKSEYSSLKEVEMLRQKLKSRLIFSTLSGSCSKSTVQPTKSSIRL